MLKLILGKKLVLCCSYNPNKNKILPDLHVIDKALDNLSRKYENVTLNGWFQHWIRRKAKKKLPKYFLFKTKDLFPKPR